MSTSPIKSANLTTRATRLSLPATTTNLSVQTVRDRLRALGLYGLASQAEELMHEPWLARVLEIEEAERHRRSLNRRMGNARLGTRANAGPSIGGAGLRQASATLTQRACGDYEDGSDDL